VTTPSKWKHFQQRTGWPFGPWMTAIVVLIVIAIFEGLIVGTFELLMMQGVQ
jgi:hypothetical protein